MLPVVSSIGGLKCLVQFNFIILVRVQLTAIQQLRLFAHRIVTGRLVINDLETLYPNL